MDFEMHKKVAIDIEKKMKEIQEVGGIDDLNIIYSLLIVMCYRCDEKGIKGIGNGIGTFILNIKD